MASLRYKPITGNRDVVDLGIDAAMPMSTTKRIGFEAPYKKVFSPILMGWGGLLIRHAEVSTPFGLSLCPCTLRSFVKLRTGQAQGERTSNIIWPDQ